MRFIPLFTLAVATIGVSTLTLTPSRGDEVLAIFDDEMPQAEMLARFSRTQLPLISYDTALRHVKTFDPTGDAAARLYNEGARFVIDARFSTSICNSPTPPQNADQIS